MKNIRDLKEEIEDLEFELLDAKAELHRSRLQWQEDFLKSEGRYPAGDIPRAELAKRVKLLEEKLDRKKEDLKVLQPAQLPRGGKRFGHGELKEEIARLAKRDGFKVGKTVDGKTVRRWLKEMEAGGKTTSASAIRAILSDLAIATERKSKK
jgi:hypothetical protein